jgi:hypothetical protein
MKMIVLLFVVIGMTGCAMHSLRDLPFSLQLRPVRFDAEPGYAKMSGLRSGETIYESDDVVLRETDISSARMLSGGDWPQIAIVFRKGGNDHVAGRTNQPLGLFVNGLLMGAPMIFNQLPGSEALLQGPFTKEETKIILDGLKEQIREGTFE